MLTPRLRAIVDMVEGAQTAADIGCDHGYVAGALLEEGRAKRVIACDISEKSLEKAAKLAILSGLEGRMETRLGNGLAVLQEGEADTVIIAGMGGMLIRDMLERKPKVAESVKRFVLVPHKNEAELRAYLFECGYEITDEALAVEEERYYQIICARPRGGEGKQDEFYHYVGRRLIEKQDPSLDGFLRKRIAETEKIILGAAGGRDTAEYVRGLERRVQRMREVLEQCQMWMK